MPAIAKKELPEPLATISAFAELVEAGARGEWRRAAEAEDRLLARGYVVKRIGAGLVPEGGSR